MEGRSITTPSRCAATCAAGAAGAGLGVLVSGFILGMAYLLIDRCSCKICVTVNTNKKNVVLSDAKIYEKVIRESLIVCGYRVFESSVEVTKGFERAWIIEFRIEV